MDLDGFRVLRAISVGSSSGGDGVVRVTNLGSSSAMSALAGGSHQPSLPQPTPVSRPPKSTKGPPPSAS